MNLGLFICASLFIICLIIVAVDIAIHKTEPENIDYLNYANYNNGSSSDAENDTIYEFKELLDMGAITQEEFESKKKELLDIK